MSCLGEGKVSSRGSGWPGDEMIEVFGTGLGGKKTPNTHGYRKVKFICLGRKLNS